MFDRTVSQVLQKAFINRILNPLGKLSEKLNRKLSDAIFLSGLLLIIFQYFAYQSGLVHYRYLIFFSLDCAFFSIMLFSLLHGDMKPVSFRPFLMILWIGFGLTILISGLLVRVDSLPEATLVLIAFPVFFIVCGNTDINRVFRLLLRGGQYSFYVYLVVSTLFYPVGVERYSGLFGNVNTTASYLVVVAACFLIDSLYDEKLSASCFSKIVFIAVSTSLIFYTNSRTALGAYICMLVFTFFCYLLPRRFRISKVFLIKLISFILLVVLSIAVILYVIQIINVFANLIADWVEGFFSDDVTISKQTTIIDNSSYLDIALQKITTDNKTLDQYTANRLTIWMLYLKELNLSGHKDALTHTVHYSTKTVTTHTSHMTFLQTAYNYGIISGILYLLFTLSTGFGTIWYALRSKETVYACLPLAITVAFGCFCLFESISYTFSYPILFYYYLLQAPLFVKKKRA